jgi:hypothetical protein
VRRVDAEDTFTIQPSYRLSQPDRRRNTGTEWRSRALRLAPSGQFQGIVATGPEFGQGGDDFLEVMDDSAVES